MTNTTTPSLDTIDLDHVTGGRARHGYIYYAPNGFLTAVPHRFVGAGFSPLGVVPYAGAFHGCWRYRSHRRW